jgi:hypothetical protein
MDVAVIEPLPGLLGPFAILFLSIAIFPRPGQRAATTLCPKRRDPRAACCWRIRDFHCCGRRILCRGRRNPFIHPATRLAAISVAATFFGGLTYIGNRPNLLIRAIAESRHVPTGGFLAYIIRYALPILIPVLALVGLIFFRG